jgi:hypothetical protein
MPLGFLLLGAGILRKSLEIQKVGLIVLILGALISLPVYFTGEPAEEEIEHLPGINEEVIEEHEEFALSTVIVVVVSGLVALVGLFLFRKSSAIPIEFLTGSLILSLVASGLLVWTAMLGGIIRHPEVRSGFATPAVGSEEDVDEDEDEDEDEEEDEDEDEHEEGHR